MSVIVVRQPKEPTKIIRNASNGVQVIQNAGESPPRVVLNARGPAGPRGAGDPGPPGPPGEPGVVPDVLDGGNF